MTDFGERRGARTYSRDSLVQKQQRRLVDLSGVTENPRKVRFDGLFSETEWRVGALILLEQFPEKRITAEELHVLEWNAGQLYFFVDAPPDILKRSMALAA